MSFSMGHQDGAKLLVLKIGCNLVNVVIASDLYYPISCVDPGQLDKRISHFKTKVSKNSTFGRGKILMISQIIRSLKDCKRIEEINKEVYKFDKGLHSLLIKASVQRPKKESFDVDPVLLSLINRESEYLTFQKQKCAHHLFTNSQSPGYFRTLFNISMSNYRRIVSLSFDSPYSSVLNKELQLRETKIKNYVRCLIQPPCPPFTIKDLMEQVSRKFEVEKSYHQIRKMVKDFGFSFKKGSSRVLKSEFKDLRDARKLYSAKFLNNCRGKLLVNIDECSCNRSTKSNYSWLPKNSSGQVLNIVSKGRASVILATMSTEDFIAMIKPETVRSDDYQNFLAIVCYVLGKAGHDLADDVLFIHDNASPHSSKSTV